MANERLYPNPDCPGAKPPFPSPTGVTDDRSCANEQPIWTESPTCDELARPLGKGQGCCFRSPGSIRLPAQAGLSGFECGRGAIRDLQLEQDLGHVVSHGLLGHA